MHSEWTDLLSEYLDDELDAVTRRRVEHHLAECQSCAAVLNDLRRIVAVAPGYQGSNPSTELWPGIAAGIEARRVVTLPRRAGARWRELIAAGLLMAAAGAGATWYWVRGTVPAAGPVAEPPVLTAATPAGLNSARYDAAVAELEETLAANRARLDTATVRVLEQSLRSIDQAIAEARAAIQRDTANAYLNGQIAVNMRKKLNVLRLATRAIASET